MFVLHSVHRSVQVFPGASSCEQMCMPICIPFITIMQADTGDLSGLFGLQDASQTGQSQATPALGEQRMKTSRRLKWL